MVFGLIVGALSAAASLAVKALACVGVAKLLQAVGKALGLIKEEEKPEDLGDKALQAEEQGITPDKFKTYEEYANRIQNFELDSEKSKKYTPEEKMKKTTEVFTKYINEKHPDMLGTIIDLNKLATVEQNKPGYLESDQRAVFIGEALKNDPQLAGDISRYLSGSETDTTNISNTIDKMMNIEKGANPGMSDAEAYKAVAGLRN